MSMNFSSSENATISSKISVGVLLRQTEDRRVHEDVLAAGELVVEAGAELEQRSDAAAGDDLTARGLQDAGHALQQRRLAGAVVARGCRRSSPASTSKSTSCSAHERLVGDPAVVHDPLFQRRVVLVVERNCFETLRTSIAAAILELLREVRLRTPEHPYRDREEDEPEHERVAEVRDVCRVRPVRQQRRARWSCRVVERA